MAPEPDDEPQVQRSGFHGLRAAPVADADGEAIAEAAGELDHRRLAEEHGAGVGEPLMTVASYGELLRGQRRGAPRRRVPAHGEEILGHVGDAVQRAAPGAGGDLRLGAPAPAPAPDRA